MAAALRIGQHVQGNLGRYCLSTKLHETVWTAIESQSSKKIILKSAPPQRLDNELRVLQKFENRLGIRRLVDQVQQPPLLVLQYLDSNLLAESHSTPLSGPELKKVARTVLQALQALHSEGYVHTDVKPDNILVNNNRDAKSFSEVVLGDYGDTYHMDTTADPNEDGHIIGAAIFRSPEAMFNLRWGPPTDIWSFGVTLISLIWGKGWHIFKPTGVDPADDAYPVRILMNHVNFFGPFPGKFNELVPDEERQGMVAKLNDYFQSLGPGVRKPFAQAEDAVLSVETRSFLCRILKLDPRDRPTASELLEDEWFNEA
ncbi:hypothetical protein FQN50_004388 [Emmonsiellopsis sp. PD_5]|nr:hypothetical protein FQN50_004388 [Emmonsiellopsis sp. PD_5]